MTELLKNPGHEALWNSFGATASNGMDQVISTQTRIVEGVLGTKYYELLGQKLGDFFPVEIGKGKDSMEIFQYTASYTGGDFEEGEISLSTGMQANATSGVEFGGFTAKNHFWRNTYSIQQEMINVAAQNQVAFSLIEEHEKASKKKWDLGIQRISFLGTKDGQTKGLYDVDGVTVNTSLLPAKVSAITAAQIKTLAANIISAYVTANGGTALPNRWVMPQEEFLALNVPVNPDYPSKTILEIIMDVFKGAGCVDFRILHTKYGETADSTGAKGRHVLYNYSPDSLKLSIPQDYTPHALFPKNAMELLGMATGQYIGLVVTRPKEVLYMDVTEPVEVPAEG